MKYTEEHEWLREDGEVITIGITEHASEQLGDIVFVDLPEIGASFEKGDEMAVIESVKAASEISAPLAGEVVEVNSALGDEPGKVNASPMDEGWFLKIKPVDASALDGFMDEAAYKAMIG